MIDRLGSMDALRSQMRKMSPQQLQQLAMQHQNDAIVLSLVSQEQNDREKAKVAQMGASQQQPKVNEQVIAKLSQQAQPLPEEVGIGRLPAQNMEGMADGGIVGYNGEADSLVTGGYLNTPAGAGIPYYFPGPSAERDRLNRLPYDTLKGWWDSLTGDERLQWNRVGKEKQAEAAANWGREVRGAAPTLPVDQTQDQTQGQGQGQGQQGQVQQKPPAGLGALAATRPALTNSSAIDQVKRMQNDAQAAVGKAEIDPEQKQMLEATEANRLAQAKRTEEGIAERETGLGALLKSKEDRIAAREGKIGEQEKQDQNMALIRAGLALATSTKRGFGAAVAEGANVGLDALSKSMALTKAERQKVDDAKDAMEDLRFNQNEMTRKEKITAQNAVDEVKNIAREKMITALMDAKKVSREAATHMADKALDLQKSQEALASHERIAANQVAAMRERAAGTVDDRKLRDAESAFARDPEVATIKKQLESPLYAMSPAKGAPLNARLKQIQAEKYKAFGVTLPEGPGATPAPALKYNPATGKIE